MIDHRNIVVFGIYHKIKSCISPTLGTFPGAMVGCYFFYFDDDDDNDNNFSLLFD